MSEGLDDLEVEEPLGNPAPPPDVDLEKLRGDRIGDTVFSEKWCIQTVMKLMQSNVLQQPDSKDESDEIVDMDDELQNEVGALWDMTSNVQVCQYLHTVGAVESICHVISNSRCPRATEMCVGILANIVYHDELWDIMENDTTFFTILVQLLTSTDQPVLLEVNRFFNTALCHKSSTSIYSTLDDHGLLVTNELLRILSGSTNSDLLKQATELVYTLMYRDEMDTAFNTRFANSDFVMAVVEASKELGCSHESSGQNTVMEILHCFTTTEAGAVAIGDSLEEMSTVSTAYLRTLCQQGLSLASNCPVITSILSLLHHTLLRSHVVRDFLFTTPSFLHCVLISLVALYRKLGLYHTISGHSSNLRNSNKQRQHHLITASTSWQSYEEKVEEEAESRNEGKVGKISAERRKAGSKAEDSPFSGTAEAAQGSWSERAFAAARVAGGVSSLESEATAFRTPDASPRAASLKGGKNASDFQVSWSERRWASPIVAGEQGEEEETSLWKRPLEKGKIKKRKNKNEKTQKEGVDEETEDKGEELTYKTIENDGELDQEHMTEDDSKDKKVGKIRGQSRLSEGFTPRLDNEKNEVFSGDSHDFNAYKSDIDRKDPNINQPGNTCGDAASNLKSNSDTKLHGIETSEVVTNVENTTNTLNSGSSDPSQTKDIQHQSGDRSRDDTEIAMDVGFDYQDKDTDGDDEDGGTLNRSTGSTDRYTLLYSVIRDLLVDYCQKLTEVSTIGANRVNHIDTPAPRINATLAYLDRQCSSTELRALARCVHQWNPTSHSGDQQPSPSSLPVQNLLHLCDTHRLTRVKSFLLASSTNGAS